MAAFGASAILALALAYSALLALSPLPAHVMDRDESGLVSLGEAVDSYDTDHRPHPAKPGCVEYFWLKDGTAAYISCEGAGAVGGLP